MPQQRSPLRVRQEVFLNASFLAILALIVVIITSLYVSHERNFHWWIDWYGRTLNVIDAYRESPSKAIQLVRESLNEERNFLYMLPLVPFMLTFGTSRLVYEIGLALVYLLPFALVTGAIATRLVSVYPQAVFWSTVVVTLLLPATWVSTLMGIPDTGGALFIALATFVCLQDVRLRQWWQVPLVGILIGLAILLRRHFVYGGIALLGALSWQTLIYFAIELRKNPPLACRNLLLSGVRIGLIAAATLVTLIAIAPEFTHRALTTDYRAYHASWSLPFSDIFNQYAWLYGWGTWLMVTIGFGLAFLTGKTATHALTRTTKDENPSSPIPNPQSPVTIFKLELPALRFLGLSGVFSLIIWVCVLRYGNVFYASHVTPLIVIGLVALIWSIGFELRGNIRTLILSGVGCYLASNLVLGLTPLGKFNSFFRPFFALNIPPLVRTDYDEVVRLIAYLRQLTPKREPIYIVGYQRLQLETSLIKSTERLLYGRKGKRLNILQASLVDSRDPYPLQKLLQAAYIVVPNSLAAYPRHPADAPAVGEWLPDKEVGVVRAVFDAFTQNWDFARDFKRLPVRFALEGGAVASIYQRIRPTSLETAVRTLYAMQQEIGDRSAGQKDWIALSPLGKMSFTDKNADNTYRLVMLQSQRTPKLANSFLYLGALSGSVEVRGAVSILHEPCTRLSLRLAMLDRNGQILNSTQKEIFSQSAIQLQPIRSLIKSSLSMA